MNYLISRPINGISVNGPEYLYDDEQQLMEFPSHDDAVNFLSKHYPTLSRIQIEESFDIHQENTTVNEEK
jgi:hypothetical protein